MEVKPGYKLTEVGVIPEDWEAVKLQAICSMKSGVGITSTSIDSFSDYPCFGGNGLRGYTKRFTHNGTFALIGRQGALCGNVVLVQGKFFASEHAIVVTARPETNIIFLTYVLRRMQLNQYSESSAQPGLSVSKISQLTLSVPPTAFEQRAIAEVLSDVDALISALDRLIAKKRDLKQAAMQELLTGKTRLPGFSGEWEVKKLGEVAHIIMGQSPSSRNYNRTGNGVPLIQGNTDIENRHSITRVWTTQITKEGRTGDLLLTVRAPVGSVGRISEKCCLGRGVCSIRPYLNVEYLFHNLVFAESEWKVLEQGSTFTSANSMQVSTFSVLMPVDLSEQSAIAAVLSDMDAEIAALEARREKTRALKEGMMQELLTGRTRLVSRGDAEGKAGNGSREGAKSAKGRR
jgi:type I restriction enzyme S subunit